MPRTRTLLILPLLAACAPGDGSDTGAPGHAVRDSAGVEIVESARPAWSPAEAWRLAPEPLYRIRASDGGPEHRLLDPMSIDIDTRGRVIVGDGNQVGWDAVLVYDSLGRFLFQTGGQGRGPGEFRQLWWASTYTADSIIAFDMGDDRVSVFDPEGEFARDVRVPPLVTPRPPQGTYGYTAGIDAAYGDGSFLAYPFGAVDVGPGEGPAWSRHLLLRLSPDGVAWDTLGDFEIYQYWWTGREQEELYYAPMAVAAVGTDELFFGRGESFEIRRHDATGDVTRIIRRPHEPRPVTEELKAKLREWYLARVGGSREASAEVLERMRRRLEAARFADVLPPYSAALVDELGNLWIEEFRWLTPTERPSDPGPALWSVFDTSGVWLGNVETPPGFILREVAAGRALGFVIDENDVKEIVAYRLERPSMR